MTRILMFSALMASAIVSLMFLAVFLRFFLGMFSDGGIFAGFVYAATEPMLRPIRSVFDRMGLFEDSPFDFSMLAAMTILMLLSLFLPTIY